MYQSEIEFKFFPENIVEAVKNLEKLAICTQPETLFRSTHYHLPENPTFHEMDSLRVRDEGSRVVVTMKWRHVDGVRLSHALEKEFEVENYELTIELFAHIGLVVTKEQERLRTTWELDNCMITLDKNPWLDPYFEIEGPDEEIILSVASQLGFPLETRENVSHGELYRRKYGKEAYGKIKEILFAQNPFGES